MTLEASTPIQPIRRAFDLAVLLRSKSHFLLGPRQTGKTTLIRSQLPDAVVYDLLDSSVFLALSQNPGRLGDELTASDQDRRDRRGPDGSPISSTRYTVSSRNAESAFS